MPVRFPLQTPFGMGAMGGLPGMANLGMGSANFMEMQQRMQSEVLGNPDMLRQIMDSPLTQSLMSNPEIMRSLIQANPQMQQVRQGEGQVQASWRMRRLHHLSLFHPSRDEMNQNRNLDLSLSCRS